MCAIQRVNGQAIYYQVHPLQYPVQRHCNAAVFFLPSIVVPCVSRMVHHQKDNQPTVGSIGVNMGQQPSGTLSTPCRVHALMN